MSSLMMVIVATSTGCEKDGDDSGGGGGNCTDNANQIQTDMTSAQVIDIMGRPDSTQSGGGETRMTWLCGSDYVQVDFQPGDRVYFVMVNDDLLVIRDSFYQS